MKKGRCSATGKTGEVLNRANWLLMLAGVAVVAMGCGGRREHRQEARGATVAQPDWQAVERALGRRGAVQAGDVYKFGLPRTDLHVTVGGIPLEPALALGSWVAFKATSVGSIVMGDLVLRDREIERVMARLAQDDIAVTALHHHVLWETPRVYYLHFYGTGDAVQLARAIRGVIDLTTTPAPAADLTAPSETPIGLDTGRIALALGHSGTVSGKVYHVSLARPDTIRYGSVVIPPAMGVATTFNFQSAGRGQAATTGDFVLRAAEVNPVLRALRERGIAVTALHNHMLGEEPRLFFMHFWAVGDAGQLAGDLRDALDVMRGAGR
jgi:Domain of Unknown Function (DUF1259)